jgi:hypothetical protein
MQLRLRLCSSIRQNKLASCQNCLFRHHSGSFLATPPGLGGLGVFTHTLQSRDLVPPAFVRAPNPPILGTGPASQKSDCPPHNQFQKPTEALAICPYCTPPDACWMQSTTTLTWLLFQVPVTPCLPCYAEWTSRNHPGSRSTTLNAHLCGRSNILTIN